MDADSATPLPPGTVVQLQDLEKRTELNGEAALLTSKVLENGRHEAFVFWTNDEDKKRPEGINVHDKNFTVVTTERRDRANAWNKLGNQFANSGNYSNGIDAFQCALDVASKQSDECRVEGCDALSLMVWLGLRMNNEGKEFEGERTASKIVKFGLNNLFAEVLQSTDIVTESSDVNMGAGRIPSRDTPVLLLHVKTDGASRFFFYDDFEKVVHECVEKNIDGDTYKEGHDKDTVGENEAPIEASQGG